MCVTAAAVHTATAAALLRPAPTSATLPSERCSRFDHSLPSPPSARSASVSPQQRHVLNVTAAAKPLCTMRMHPRLPTPEPCRLSSQLLVSTTPVPHHHPRRKIPTRSATSHQLGHTRITAATIPATTTATATLPATAPAPTRNTKPSRPQTAASTTTAPMDQLQAQQQHQWTNCICKSTALKSTHSFNRDLGQRVLHYRDFTNSLQQV
jgi:hypothetical protein